jgi:hypothetical protein
MRLISAASTGRGQGQRPTCSMLMSSMSTITT